VLGVLASFILTVQVSVAGAFRDRQPQVALRWVPWDAYARARLAASLVTNQQSPEAQNVASKLAHEAILRDALTPAAVRALASAKVSDRGEGGLSLALMTEAQRLSRRDQATQIWFIERNLRQGRMEDALEHFDIAARSSVEVRDVLFPLMGSVLSEPRLYRAMTERLSGKPVWSIPFLQHLASSGSEMAPTVRLVSTFLDPVRSDERSIIATLLQRLASLRQYRLAWDLYSSSGLAHEAKGAPGSLVDGSFETNSGAEPFAWTLVQEGDLWATSSITPAKRGRVLEVGASSGRRGEVARQLVHLQPGRYELRAEFGAVAEDEFERPELRVLCASEDADELLLSVRPQSGAERISSEGRFNVTANCPFQWVSIRVGGEGAPRDSMTWIDDVALTRVTS